MFEFLFKYPLSTFLEADFESAWPWSSYWLIILAIVVIIPLLLRYAWVRGKTGILDRSLLTVLRSGIIAVLLFALFQPLLVLSTVVPQRGVLGVLLDDSRSMRIADLEGINGSSRGQLIQQLFAGQSPVYQQLAERFELRLMRFSEHVENLDQVEQLQFAGGSSRLDKALMDSYQTLNNTALAGLLLVSDGASDATPNLNNTLLTLRANGIPVHTLGIGSERFARDIELSRVHLPQSVLKDSAVIAELQIRHSGFAGRKVPLIIEDEGVIVATQEIVFEPNNDVVNVRIPFTLNEPGTRHLKIHLPVQDNEQLVINNEQQMLLKVYDRTERILYIEGEPRFELKFIRRALHDDPNLEVVTLLRTADNKFYRLGISDPAELNEGFPSEPEQLFAYQAIILGNIEAAFFTQQQLQMLKDFVSERGAGLLFLGGKQTFAEGGYADTVLADVMPVQLDHSSSGFAQAVTVSTTQAGQQHPITRLDLAQQDLVKPWSLRPALTVVNPLYKVKPGASVLLQSNADDPLVILAYQRYGRGISAAFAAQDSWIWQMHAEVTAEDQSHETFWRQLLRWLVAQTPGQLTLTNPAEQLAIGEVTTIKATVFDQAYQADNNARVRARIISPSGVEQETELTLSQNQNGVYQLPFSGEEVGLYEIRVQAGSATETASETVAETIVTEELYIQVSSTAGEYHQAELQSDLLQRIANTTGGQFFRAANAGDLAELGSNLNSKTSTTTVLKRHDLWDMPILFILLIVLLAGEWFYRRWRELA